MEKQILPEIKKPEALEIAIHCLGVQAEQEVCEECPAYGESRIICKEVAIVAISALKEIQQYREIGTVEECRKAVDKTKPKAPKDELKINPVIDENGAYVDADTTVYILCPNCGELVGMDEDIDRFCRECGQAIRWNENLEGMEDV